MVYTVKNNTVILGLGVTGLSCARFLAFQNKPFTIVDTREKPAMSDEFSQEFGQQNLYLGGWHEDILLKANRLIVSPGISLNEPAIVNAIKAGVQVISDIDLLLSVISCPVAAITGSNGKTTVTTLLGEMAKASGLNTVVAGNIGLPVLDAYLDSVKSEKFVDLYVLELSSFQLERVGPIKAKAACVLNVTPDHMDRYDSLDHYAKTKRYIFSEAKNCIYNASDILTKPEKTESTLVGTQLSKIDIVYSTSCDGSAVFYHADDIALYKENDHLLDIVDLAIKGKHNQFNALSAFAMGESLGLDENSMISTLKTFSGLPHRCENIASHNGITFINDSKGTNEGACIAAIKGLSCSTNKNIVLIAGGDDKGADFPDLESVVLQFVKHTILIGRAQSKLQALLEPESSVSLASTMDNAVSLAYNLAEKGDVVLLSPACASFDMYKGFEHRGFAFSDAVKNVINKEGAR